MPFITFLHFDFISSRILHSRVNLTEKKARYLYIAYRIVCVSLL